MKLKYSETPSVPIAEAKARALAYLHSHAIGFSAKPVPAAWVARAIWPNHKMKSQGAGAAASRVLKHLERDGLAKWSSNRNGWGWCALGKPPSEAERALKRIREVTDGALDESGLLEAVEILISQRDNARAIAASYKAKLKELGVVMV